MRFMMALILSACLLTVTACERSDRTTRAAYGDPEAERDRYEDLVNGRLKEFELRFDGLEARLKGLDEASKQHLQTDIAELRDRKEALERKYKDLRRVSADSWMDVRRSIDQDLDQLEVAYSVVSANNHGNDHAPLESLPRR